MFSASFLFPQIRHKGNFLPKEKEFIIIQEEKAISVQHVE